MFNRDNARYSPAEPDYDGTPREEFDRELDEWRASDYLTVLSHGAALYLNIPADAYRTVRPALTDRSMAS